MHWNLRKLIFVGFMVTVVALLATACFPQNGRLDAKVNWVVEPTSPMTTTVSTSTQPMSGTMPISTVVTGIGITQTTTVTGMQTLTGTAKVENLGLWVWKGNRPPMPNPAAADQVIVAHGDIDNSGGCGIRVFYPSQKVEGLSDGTFRLVRITGNFSQISDAVVDVRKEAAKSTGTCPDR